MGDNDTCSRCGDALDPASDHHVSVAQTSMDVRTADKETTERLFCTDCADAYLGLDTLDGAE